ncbi:hypothetical protein Bhyg_10185, partial [Pseudolycoriella hygida]
TCDLSQEAEFLVNNLQVAMAIENTLTILLVMFCAVAVYASIGDFGFPEEEDEDATKQNAEARDQKDDWVCDCKPGHIYYPKTDRCYSAYRQGPCLANEFLMIGPGKYIPECLPNRCNSDGLVTFKNACHSLNKAGPCELPELSY